MYNWLVSFNLIFAHALYDFFLIKESLVLPQILIHSEFVSSWHCIHSGFDSFLYFLHTIEFLHQILLSLPLIFISTYFGLPFDFDLTSDFYSLRIINRSSFKSLFSGCSCKLYRLHAENPRGISRETLAPTSFSSVFVLYSHHFGAIVHWYRLTALSVVTMFSCPEQPRCSSGLSGKWLVCNETDN